MVCLDKSRSASLSGWWSLTWFGKWYLYQGGVDIPKIMPRLFETSCNYWLPWIWILIGWADAWQDAQNLQKHQSRKSTPSTVSRVGIQKPPILGLRKMARIQARTSLARPMRPDIQLAKTSVASGTWVLEVSPDHFWGYRKHMRLPCIHNKRDII